MKDHKSNHKHQKEEKEKKHSGGQSHDEEHDHHNHNDHSNHESHDDHDHDDHSGHDHQDHHAHMIKDFRTRFWISLALSAPIGTATHRKMIQNLLWAAGYNIVAIPLAAGVLISVGILLSPAVGAALMSLSTIIVAINAQLLRRQVN